MKLPYSSCSIRCKCLYLNMWNIKFQFPPRNPFSQLKHKQHHQLFRCEFQSRQRSTVIRLCKQFHRPFNHPMSQALQRLSKHQLYHNHLPFHLHNQRLYLLPSNPCTQRYK